MAKQKITFTLEFEREVTLGSPLVAESGLKHRLLNLADNLNGYCQYKFLNGHAVATHEVVEPKTITVEASI